MDDYSSQWHHYRVLNRTGMIAFAAFLAVLPISIAAQHLGHLDWVSTKRLFTIFGVAALLSLWAVLLAIVLWRCPRCHERYSRRSLLSVHSLGRECVHCGLKMYEGDAMPANPRLERP
jgi:hypothetical protein